MSIGVVEGHLESNTMIINRGVYDVYFQLSPPYYIPNTESIISYSILKEGNDVRDVIVSFKIERDDNILYSFENVRFESGDLSIKYTFPNYGVYILTLTAYIEKDGELLVTSIEVNMGDVNITNNKEQIIWLGIILGAISGATFIAFKMRSR